MKPAGAASPHARRVNELAPFSPTGYFYPARLGFAPSFSTSLPGVALRSRSPPGAPAAVPYRAGCPVPGDGTGDAGCRTRGVGGCAAARPCSTLPASSLVRKSHPGTRMASPPPSPSRSPFPRAPRDAVGLAGGGDELRHPPPSPAHPALPAARSSASKRLLRPRFSASSFQPVPGGSSPAPRRVSCPGD